MQRKALVVDDNMNNLLLERDLLEVAGFVVLQAETAVGGITMARLERPDVIIMDVRLPDMRGSEAAKVLRRNRDTHDIPIVFVTASVMAEGREELKGIHNTGFIGKPIDTRTFAKEINDFIK
jgi:CheY-like chemotaxis protein